MKDKEKGQGIENTGWHEQTIPLMSALANPRAKGFVSFEQ